MCVITISVYQVVVWPRRRDSTYHDCFLSNIKMTKAADLLRLILLTGALLETPNQEHEREHFDFVALLRRLHGRSKQREAKPRQRVIFPALVRNSCR